MENIVNNTQADIIVWDFEEKSLLYRLKMHKVLIQSLSFSHNEQYLASLGGQDDKSTLILWDVTTGKSLLGTSLGAKDPVIQAKFYNKSDDKLLAISTQGIQIVIIERTQRKVSFFFFLKRKFFPFYIYNEKC